MSCIFFSLFEDINREFALTGGNLEIVIEMLISSPWRGCSDSTTTPSSGSFRFVAEDPSVCLAWAACDGCCAWTRRRAFRLSREMATFG